MSALVPSETRSARGNLNEPHSAGILDSTPKGSLAKHSW